MKILEHSSRRLIMQNDAGLGRTIGIVFGFGLFAGALIYQATEEAGLSDPFEYHGGVVVFGIIGFAIGVIAMTVSNTRVAFDRDRGRVLLTSKNPVLRTGSEIEVKLEDIAGFDKRMRVVKGERSDGRRVAGHAGWDKYFYTPIMVTKDGSEHVIALESEEKEADEMVKLVRTWFAPVKEEAARFGSFGGN